MPCFKQGVGQAAVEIQALLVHRTPTVGNHPRPGDAEAIVFDAQFGHQLHVVFEAMIVVAGHVARVAVDVRPGVWLNVSQTLGLRPSSAAAPSTW